MNQNFINMKIPVEGNLDRIVAELERLGFREERTYNDGVVCVIANTYGLYSILNASNLENPYTTTLSELKEME